MAHTVQLAGQEDAEIILALMRRMQIEDAWEESFHETTVRKNLQEILANPTYGLVFLVREALVREAQIPIGYLVLCFDFSLEYRGKGAWIDELFVESEYRGKGIGTELLELAETASREHGAQVLHLEVNYGNRAIELYRRRGFVDHQRFLMTKSLQS
jgi:GNAT superfamily N-acetyltransferase